MRIYSLGKYLILLLLFACSDYSTETSKLRKVLQKYERSIPEDNHMFIIRSQFYCDGCVQSIYKELEIKLKKADNTMLSVICADNEYMSNEFLSKVLFISDSMKMSDKVFSSFANLTFIETQRGEIVRCKNLSDINTMELPMFVHHFFERNKAN